MRPSRSCSIAREAIRTWHDTRRTEKAYVAWIRRYYDIRTVQELLGHNDVSTTQIYSHVVNRRPGAVPIPVDAYSAYDAPDSRP